MRITKTDLYNLVAELNNKIKMKNLKIQFQLRKEYGFYVLYMDGNLVIGGKGREMYKVLKALNDFVSFL